MQPAYESPVTTAANIIRTYPDKGAMIEAAHLSVSDEHVTFVVRMIEHWWMTYKVGALKHVAAMLSIRDDSQRRAYFRIVPKAARADVKAIYAAEQRWWMKYRGGSWGKPPRELLITMIERRRWS